MRGVSEALEMTGQRFCHLFYSHPVSYPICMPILKAMLSHIKPWRPSSLQDSQNQEKIHPMGWVPNIVSFFSHFSHYLLSSLHKIHVVCMHVIILCAQDDNLFTSFSSCNNLCTQDNLCVRLFVRTRLHKIGILIICAHEMSLWTQNEKKKLK